MLSETGPVLWRLLFLLWHEQSWVRRLLTFCATVTGPRSRGLQGERGRWAAGATVGGGHRPGWVTELCVQRHWGRRQLGFLGELGGPRGWNAVRVGTLWAQGWRGHRDLAGHWGSPEAQVTPPSWKMQAYYMLRGRRGPKPPLVVGSVTCLHLTCSLAQRGHGLHGPRKPSWGWSPHVRAAEQRADGSKLGNGGGGAGGGPPWISDADSAEMLLEAGDPHSQPHVLFSPFPGESGIAGRGGTVGLPWGLTRAGHESPH